MTDLRRYLEAPNTSTAQLTIKRSLKWKHRGVLTGDKQHRYSHHMWFIHFQKVYFFCEYCVFWPWTGLIQDTTAMIKEK